jgi:hypothetical protein
MITDEKKRMLAAIFDSVTPSADEVRLKACEVWRPYLAAAIPGQSAPRAGQGVNGAEDGGQVRGSDNSSGRSGRPRVAPAGEKRTQDHIP